MGRRPNAAKAKRKGPPPPKTADEIIDCYDELVIHSVGRLSEPKGAVQLTLMFRNFESASWTPQSQSIGSARIEWAQMGFEQFFQMPAGKNCINNAILVDG